ncbi:SDR family oxidoreductase, partial [Acinetobacter baumannii]|nr:SDR family oxidoreductase [Acinetobacter baumannii]
MNILVTGATGFVGKELLKKLIINPSIDRVTALVRKYNLDFDPKVI